MIWSPPGLAYFFIDLDSMAHGYNHSFENVLTSTPLSPLLPSTWLSNLCPWEAVSSAQPTCGVEGCTGNCPVRLLPATSVTLGCGPCGTSSGLSTCSPAASPHLHHCLLICPLSEEWPTSCFTEKTEGITEDTGHCHLYSKASPPHMLGDTHNQHPLLLHSLVSLFTKSWKDT